MIHSISGVEHGSRSLCPAETVSYLIQALTLSQTKTTRLFQTERVCRRLFLSLMKLGNKVLQKGREHCGKRRNCLL